jgi:hypothetical protein
VLAAATLGQLVEHLAGRTTLPRRPPGVPTSAMGPLALAVTAVGAMAVGRLAIADR